MMRTSQYGRANGDAHGAQLVCHPFYQNRLNFGSKRKFVDRKIIP